MTKIDEQIIGVARAFKRLGNPRKVQEYAQYVDVMTLQDIFGLGDSAVRCALDRLTKRGVLAKHTLPGGVNNRGRAYWLYVEDE